MESTLVQGKISALITIKKIGKKEYSEILVTGSREDLHGSLKLAIENYFGVRKFSGELFCGQKHFDRNIYLGLYAENYEPFSVKYWKVGRFGDSLLVRLQQATRH